jgi:hypothetical protein
MRILLSLLIFAPILIRCSAQKPANFIPKEFEYPDDTIGAGKTFIYEDSLTKRQHYENLQILDSNGKKLKITKSYDSSSVSDSVRYLDDKLVEHYNFFLNKGGNPIKAENLQDTVTNNEHRLGVHSSQIRYRTDALIYTATTKEEFLKDTTITWQGKQLPSLVTSGNSRVEIKVKADTTVSEVMEVHLRFYYARNVGLIRYSIQFTDHTGKDSYGLWKLEKIDDDMKN